MTPRNVVVTGLGFVTSLGRDAATVEHHLRNGHHGFTRVDLRPGLEVPIKVAGIVRGYAFPTSNPREWQTPNGSEFAPSLPPHGIYALHALDQAIAQARLAKEVLTHPSTGLFAASSGSPFLLRHHLSTYEEKRWRRGHPLGIVSSIAGTLNFNLAAHYGIRGANCGFASACASSSHALGYAFDEIALGRQDHMLVVGAEECFVENVIPFDAMRALTTNDSPDEACRPFDRDRDGFVVSAGAAAMILQAEPVASGRPLARMLGWGQASDGYHITSPHPQGAGLATAMKRALKAARVQPKAIDYVNAHATSTPMGDRAEAFALRSVFRGNGTPAIVSTKGSTGHGLSLSGVLEAALTVLSIHRDFRPGNRNLCRPDEACEGLDFPTRSQAGLTNLALNNSSGFGGANVCHLFAKP